MFTLGGTRDYDWGRAHRGASGVSSKLLFLDLGGVYKGIHFIIIYCYILISDIFFLLYFRIKKLREKGRALEAFASYWRHIYIPWVRGLHILWYFMVYIFIPRAFYNILVTFYYHLLNIRNHNSESRSQNKWVSRLSPELRPPEF